MAKCRAEGRAQTQGAENSVSRSKFMSPSNEKLEEIGVVLVVHSQLCYKEGEREREFWCCNNTQEIS